MGVVIIITSIKKKKKEGLMAATLTFEAAC